MNDTTNNSEELTETEKLIPQVDALLKQLTLEALQGDFRAMRYVVELATILNEEVAGLVGEHKEELHYIARLRTSWPLNCDIHPEMKERNLRYLKVLPLGENSIWRKGGRKSYNLGKGANLVVHNLLRELWCEIYFVKDVPPSRLNEWHRSIKLLPRNYPLTQSEAKLWKQELWTFFLARHNGHPELIPRFRDLGISTAQVKDRYGTAPEGSKAFETNVRDGIRTAIFKAFDRMVNISKK